MEPCEIKMELNLKTIIAETKEVAEALNEFVDTLEQIEKKYVEPINCTCTDEEIEKSFISDVEAVKDLLPIPDEAEWIDNKCSNCGKGIEDLIDSGEWYENEKPNFCPFCGKKFKESEVK